MKVDQETVRHIARLARIKISDKEAESLESELSTILEWIEQLNEVNTENIDARNRVISMPMKKRMDEISDGGYPDDLLENAPERSDNFFAVPKVVE